ncbi:hypothetical protein [Macrococcus bovicus]|uniref:hypothetical protein n=1 Tax=Macrococcus bovicus TaxID=69968 RepID=UPI0025A51918|nr:hypothetical protein [Macrococcus bovicus]WJP97270.1 hypothetical protein QSV55_08265 [Macrococcus bovicus]
MKPQIYIVQDGEELTKEVEHLFEDIFSYNDVRISSKKKLSNFVGFIFHESNWLVSFPKHYFDYKNKPLIAEPSDIETLFKCLMKYNSYHPIEFGKEDVNNSSYPLKYFFNIYDYYKKYGLYYIEEKNKSFGYNGKIIWKETLQKSSQVISDGNIIYIPPIVQKNNMDYDFVTKCMAYAIDNTIEQFKKLLKLERTNFDISGVDWEKKDAIIRRLKKIERETFKDKHLRLIKNLICFFQDIPSGKGQYVFKTNNFKFLWEEMMSFYINNYLLFESESNNIYFSDDKLLIPHNFKKERFYPDARRKSKSRRLEPDLFNFINNEMYIYDAKYYSEVKKLDYKQVSYYFLLKDIKKTSSEREILIHNFLFLPTYLDNYQKDHFILDPFYNNDEENFVIKEYYVNAKNVLIKFLNV